MSCGFAEILNYFDFDVFFFLVQLLHSGLPSSMLNRSTEWRVFLLFVILRNSFFFSALSMILAVGLSHEFYYVEIYSLIPNLLRIFVVIKVGRNFK